MASDVWRERAVSMKRRVEIPLGRMAAVLTTVLLLSGCGGSASAKGSTQTGLTVEKDGQVVFYIVDSFDKGYYDIDELRDMAQREVEAHNGGKSYGEAGSVSLESVAKMEGDEQQVRVVYRFSDSAAYSAFQKEMLYYETIEQAIQSRHIFSGTVLFNGGETITLDEENQKKMAGRHILVTETAAKIHLPYGVAYYSEGVQLMEDGSVDTSECREPAVLLLKK